MRVPAHLWSSSLAVALVAGGLLAARAAMGAAADTTSRPAWLVEHRSPGEALAIGLGATLAPPVLSAVLNPPGSHSAFAWEASLTLGAAAGVFIGPAVGLWSGGRPDLARRGLKIRGLGALAIGVGLLAILSAVGNDNGNAGLLPLALLGGGGVVLEAVSCVHDLAITPSATERGRARAAGLGVDPRGRVAAWVRF